MTTSNTGHHLPYHSVELKQSIPKFNYTPPRQKAVLRIHINVMVIEDISGIRLYITFHALNTKCCARDVKVILLKK